MVRFSQKVKRNAREMFRFLVRYFRKPSHVVSYLFLSFIVFSILKIIPVYHILKDFFSIRGLPLHRYFEVLYEYIFLTCGDHVWKTRLVTIFLALLISLNIVLFFLYAKRQGSFLRMTHKSLLGSLGGIILGFFGIGCISCGAFILAPLITFLGLGAYMKFFTEHAELISFIGVFFVLISNLYLLYQLQKPIVCNVE